MRDTTPESGKFWVYERAIKAKYYGIFEVDPDLLEMYERGRRKLDELVTRTYTLDEINDGYADLHAGLTMRGATRS